MPQINNLARFIYGLIMNTIQTLLRHAVEMDTLPRELSGCSPVFLAILGYLVDVNVTHPVLIDLQVTGDGMVLARHEGDMGFDHALGISHVDLLRNLNGLCDALSVPTAEREELLRQMPQPAAEC